jgi:hypothetical protein
MRKILEAVLVGALFGFLTHIAINYLPNNLQFLVETKIIWLLPAFLLAFNMPLRRHESDSIIVSIVTIISTGIAFYLIEPFFKTGNFSISEDFLKFIPLGLTAGAATGIFAYLGHSATNQIVRYGSVSLLPAIYTGDGINDIAKTFDNFEFTPEIGIKVIGGILFYLLISGKHRFKTKSIFTFIVLAAITAGIYFVWYN